MPRISPERVCIDHVEEHTIRLALDAGHWVGMTLYPITKCTPARAADMIEMYGPERVMVNSAGDWGHSDPLAVPEFIFEMRRRGHDENLIRKIVFDNPLAFFSQCHRFQFNAANEVLSSRGGVTAGWPADFDQSVGVVCMARLGCVRGGRLRGSLLARLHGGRRL